MPGEATNSASPYLEQLAELASPVPDFAATLMTRSEQDADDENLHFLRTQPSAVTSSSRLQNWTPLTMSSEHFTSENTESHRRIRRVIEAVAGNMRYTPAQLQGLGDSHENGYSSQGPSGGSQYHGWAPGSSEYEDDFANSMLNLYHSAGSHHGPPTRRSSRRIGGSMRDSRIPQLSQTSSPERSHFRDLEGDDSSETGEPSLRTAALLQSVRRSSPFSARARSHLQHYLHERERMGHDADDRDRHGSSRLARQSSLGSSTRGHRQVLQQQQQQAIHQQSTNHHQQQQPQRHQIQERASQRRELLVMQREWMEAQDQENQPRPSRAPVETYRQRYLENPSASPPIASRSLDDAIKYLERLRFCESVQDSLSSAKAGGFVQDDLFTNSDFVLDIATIEPPPESSWLKIGSVLSGSQHAATGSSLPPFVSHSQSTTAQPFYVVRPSQRSSASLRPRDTEPARREIGSQTSYTAASHENPDGDERWPVKVTIHSIDYDSMTLSGTMEAFNVPDKTSPTNESSITTFLEGEIIDFNKHTLETKSFNANTRTDGTYWRKLEPFKRLTDDEIVRSLVSKKWFTEELSRNWILMRWKGTISCF